MTRSNSSEITRGRVTIGASSRAVEVLPARFGITSLQIGRVDALASALTSQTSGTHCIPLRMNECDQCRNLVIRAIKWRHALVQAAIAYNRANLVAFHIGRDQLGASQVRTALATSGITSMAKRAILSKQGFSFLD